MWASCDVGSRQDYLEGEKCMWGCVDKDTVYRYAVGLYSAEKNNIVGKAKTTKDQMVAVHTGGLVKSVQTAVGLYKIQPDTRYVHVCEYKKYCTANVETANDGKTTLDPEDDLASARMKDRWRIPSPEEWQELFDNCDVEVKIYDGNDYLVFKSRVNGNSISIPYGAYWTNKLGLSDDNAVCVSPDNGGRMVLAEDNRATEKCVRAVCDMNE